MEYAAGTYSKFHGAFAKIYTLADSTGKVFYVGCTVVPLSLRLKGHISYAKNDRANKNKKNQVIRDLNYEVVASVIDTKWVTGRDATSALAKAKPLETSWIVKYRMLGYDLCNCHPIK